MAEKPAVARPPFEADDHADDVVVAGDAVSSPKGLSALARFEFESGKGNEGTKILMVEWEERDNDEWTRSGGGEWLVQWEGKSTVLQVKDNEETHHRLYILLPYGVTIPPTIVLTRKPLHSNNKNNNDKDDANPPPPPKPLHIHPLPAIFPPSLGASARTAGKKGVLHTIWAKKRLSVLQKEIDSETRKNTESVGLEMAIQEKAWIEQNFGVGAGARPSISIPITGSTTGPYPLSPTKSPTKSPTTPGGGRLAEKLKGLRVGTSPAELSSRHPRSPSSGISEFPPTAPPTASQGSSDQQNPSTTTTTTTTTSQTSHPLSPESSDVAISSFSAFHGTIERPSHPVRSFSAQHPPASILAQQGNVIGLAGALSSSAGVGLGSGKWDWGRGTGGDGKMVKGEEEVDDDEDEEMGLFAVKMSPRSPEMARSPFSFGDGGRGWK